jgi:hypothetical protein
MAAKPIRMLLLGLLVLALAASCYLIFSGEKKMPLVHQLKFPLLLSGGKESSNFNILPAGTSLYYDQAFPEGFVRYKVYVNVEGVKLESKESTEKFWLDPLTAFPVDAGNLRKMLREHPLTKEELVQILKSGAISKEEVKEILEEYSR